MTIQSIHSIQSIQAIQVPFWQYSQYRTIQNGFSVLWPDSSVTARTWPIFGVNPVLDVSIHSKERGIEIKRENPPLKNPPCG